MEQRKLIQHGRSSLTMSLPKKWLTQRGLKKGDSLYVDTEGNNIILSTDVSLDIGKIELDVTGLDRTSILLYVQGLYRYGYDEIVLRFKKPKVMHHRTKKETSVFSIVHHTVNRLVGMEIIEEKENKMFLKILGKQSGDDFKVILRRIFLLLNETSETLVEGIKKKDMTLISTIENKHDNISKFVSYGLRLLNKYGHPNVKETSLYYHIIASIDKIADILKYNSRDIQKNKIEFCKKSIEIFESISKSIRFYYELFYKFNVESVNKLSQNRDSVKEQLNKYSGSIKGDELVQLTSTKQVLEILLDLTEFRMALENWSG